MRSRDCCHYSRRELIEIIYELERREGQAEGPYDADGARRVPGGGRRGDRRPL